MDNLNDLFNLQRKSRWQVANTSCQARKQKLLLLKDEIKFRREDIKAALYQDFKKPYPESELTEIHTVLDEINFAVKNLKQWMKPKKVSTPIVLFGSKSIIQSEAKGVVLILAPWNYPFSLLMNPLVAAIAAGNCVIAKPSEKTPATAQILKDIIEKLFLPAEIAVVLGDAFVAEQLLELPFDHIFFTGSPRVGKKVMSAASKNLTSVTLELGGKSPVIIDKNVNLSDAVRKIAWGKFINGGQTCVAPDYLFVHNDVKSEFYNLMKMQIEQHYGETSDQRYRSADLARIIDQPAFKRLQSMLPGQNPMFSDHSLEVELYVPPTILKDVATNSLVMKEEIFGPVLPVLGYDDVNEAIDYINQQEKPLALYVFSNDNKFIEVVKNKTTSGGMAINHVVLHLTNPHLPFGGVGPSGMGSYHGIHGFKAFSHEKSILHQGNFTLTSLYFPPYHTWLKKFAFKLLRLFE